MQKKNKKIEEKIIDAGGQSLGRVAAEAAVSLMGKDRPSFERHFFSGRQVKIINASKIKITVKKLEGLTNKRYSGMPGGLRILKGAETVGKKGFGELARLAVRKMLPGNKLRREMMKNLKIEE